MEEIERQLAAIRASRADSERAHVDEDELYKYVLGLIAEGASNPAQLARLALTARDIEFDRWYA